MSSSQTLTLASHLSSSEHHIATAFVKTYQVRKSSSSFPSDSRRSTLSVAILTRSTDGGKVFNSVRGASMVIVANLRA